LDLGWYIHNKTLIKHILCLTIGRLLKGFAGGIFSAVCPMFINEISPKNLRGRMGSIYYIMVWLDKIVLPSTINNIFAGYLASGSKPNRV
jgi:MFS family permease